jgi:hypothetical protein
MFSLQIQWGVYLSSFPGMSLLYAIVGRSRRIVKAPKSVEERVGGKQI